MQIKRSTVIFWVMCFFAYWAWKLFFVAVNPLAPPAPVSVKPAFDPATARPVEADSGTHTGAYGPIDRPVDSAGKPAGAYSPNDRPLRQSKWVYLGMLEGGTVAMDVANVFREGTLAKAWISQSFNVPKRSDGSPNYSSSRTLYFFDCVGWRIGIKQQAVFGDREGAVSVPGGYAFENSQVPFQAVVPDSAGADMFNRACTGSR